MPPNTFAQVEGDRQTIRRHLPRFGQIADNIHILVVLDQTVENHAAHGVRSRIGSQKRNQVARVPDIAPHQNIAIGGRLVPFGTGVPGLRRPLTCGDHCHRQKHHHEIQYPVHGGLHNPGNPSLQYTLCPFRFPPPHPPPLCHILSSLFKEICEQVLREKSKLSLSGREL